MAKSNDKITRRRAKADGPAMNLRFRNRREMQDIRRAATDKGMSMNTYILTEVLAQAREYLSYRG